MASSEVEIASLAPFGCILRDRNSPRDRFGANSSTGTSSSSSFMLVQNNEEDSSSSSPGTSWAGPTNRWARVREKVAMERECLRGEEEREIIRTQSESAVDVPNMGGVSSLVRRWMDFAGSHLNSFSGAGASDLPPVTPRNPVSEAATSEFGEDKFETEDSLTEWEVEGVDNVGKGSNPGERERERERPSVADVIKKLTTENQMQGSLVSWNNGDVAGERSSAAGRVQIVSSTAENRGAWQSVASLVLPRIRGRQALADLVTQMERQRQKEVKQLLDRCIVSKFSHRGRIQAMLRLRFMRRGIEKEGYSDYDRHFQHQQSRSVGAVAVVNRRKLFVAGTVSGEKIPRPRKPEEDHRRRQEKQSDSNFAGKRGDGTELVTECCDSKEKSTSVSEQTSELQCSTSSVVVLRERFNGGAEISCDAVNLKLTRRDIACCSTSSTVGSCSNSDQLKDTTNPLPLPSQSPLPLQGDENQSTASNNADNAHSPESPCPTTKTSTNEQETNQEEEVNEVQEELTVSTHEFSADEVPPPHNFGLEGEDGDSMSQQWGYENDADQYNGGNESDYDQLGDNNDWILDISRPRSDWEDLRQERYQEMLDPFQHNQDIRELLQRGSVSSFLSSGLRQTIDSLMMSRVQPQSNSMRVRREEFVISLPQREPVLPLNNQQEEQVVVEEDAGGVEQIEELEEGNLISWESDEVEWDTNNHDHNVSSLQQESSHLQHERTSRDNLQSSAYTNNRSSMELDFLNDLKGNIGLLHEEMSELRRFLKLCISMQSKLQHSIKHDIAAAVKHEVSTVMVKSAEKETCPLKVQKGNCCICYEMKVDSLLYRCGHMCTCFNCAHELQRSSRRCPICRSPIIDIVRPFIDS